MVSCLEISAHVAGLIGVVLLAFPAFYVARYAYLAAKISNSRAKLHPGWENVVEDAAKKLGVHRDSWGWGRFSALVAGTLAAAASYVLGFLEAVSR